MLKKIGKFWQAKKPQSFKWYLLVVGLYLLTHLPFLTSIPVFADESIYIRWAQLIIDDPGRYAFFAMNDGKTPLFIWSLVPFLKVFSDPLVAGRMLAVSVGLGTSFSFDVVGQRVGWQNASSNHDRNFNNSSPLLVFASSYGVDGWDDDFVFKFVGNWSG
jgi:hypothetical protein